MNLEETVKTGFLLIPPQSFLRKTWLKRFCAIYNSSNHGIQRIELFESEEAFVKQNPSKIIPLTDCIKVSPAPLKQQPNVFEVRVKDNVYPFSADTFQEMSDWLIAFQNVAFGKVTKVPLSSSYAKDEKQEENLLYSSMDEPEIFPVKAVSTEATIRNKLIGDYKLVITPVNLSIAEECSQGRMGRIILTWPYRHIRRYGCTTENFSFEAGRKCASGEGLFTFSTDEGMQIFQSVDSHVYILKSSQNETDVPSSPSLNEDTKNDFFTSKDSLLSKKDYTLSSIHKFIDTKKPSKTKDDESSSILQKLPTLKSIAPVVKPPRKSKPNSLDSSSSSQNSQVKDVPNEDLKYSPNVYEELFRGTTLSHSSLKRDDSDLFEHSSLAKLERSGLCSNVDKMNIRDSKHLDTFNVAASNYENCDPFFKSFSVPKDDHTYGKVSKIRQSMPSKDSTNIYGSILPKRSTSSDSAASPVYSNVSCTKNFDDFNISDNMRHPDHFVKNDAEYAQIFKKNDDSVF